MISTRRGFTLIELMVALVLTGMIALTAYVALEAGASTRERVEGPMAQRERAILGRAMLEDALRHAVDDGNSGAPFARAGDAANGDVLSFTTRGIIPPLGASGRWRVIVRQGRLEATPLDEAGPRFVAVLPGVRALRAMTLQSGEWRESLATIDHVPPVVRIEFRTVGDPLAPVVTRTAEGGFR